MPPVPGTAAQVDVAPEDMHRLVFLTWGRHLDAACQGNSVVKFFPRPILPGINVRRCSLRFLESGVPLVLLTVKV